MLCRATRRGGDGFATVGKDVIEERDVVGTEGVLVLRGFTVGERCVLTEPVLQVRPATLDDMRAEPATRDFCTLVLVERGIKQAQQGAETLLDAAMRRRGRENDVPFGILGEVA